MELKVSMKWYFPKWKRDESESAALLFTEICSDFQLLVQLRTLTWLAWCLERHQSVKEEACWYCSPFIYSNLPSASPAETTRKETQKMSPASVLPVRGQSSSACRRPAGNGTAGRTLRTVRAEHDISVRKCSRWLHPDIATPHLQPSTCEML